MRLFVVVVFGDTAEADEAGEAGVCAGGDVDVFSEDFSGVTGFTGVTALGFAAAAAASLVFDA